jgi:DNA-binding winged helix-turn-helix (wHTH) protein
MDAQSRRSGQDLYSFKEFTLDVPDRRLTRGGCPVHVAALRKALGDTRRSPAYFETVSRSGYRFVATVRHVALSDVATMERSAWFDRKVQL